MADSTGSGLAEFLRSHLQQGMTVIDVGANVGNVTVAAAAAVGVSGHVIAYEPGPAAGEALRRRCREWPQVEVRQRAVCGATGHLSFFVDPTKSTSSTLFAAVTGRAHQRVRVTACSLDSELDSLPPVDFIKIDAQAAEGHILEGSRRLLKRDKPLLIVELWPAGLKTAGTDAAQMLERLGGLGYHFHPVNAKGAVGSDLRIRASLNGSLSSAAINVLAHPRRWPSRRWLDVAPPAPCVLEPRRRQLCRPWASASTLQEREETG